MLSPSSIERLRVDSLLGRRVLYYQTLPSTMDAAWEAARGGCPEGTLVLAEEQTVARGRFDRPWLSPQGSLSLSLVLRPASLCLPSLPMVTSLAMAQAIEKATSLRPAIKWPNDIMLGGKKVCGLLIEAKAGLAVVGAGLNVNMAASAYPEVAGTATSLSQELGRDVPLKEVLLAFLEEMERLYLACQKGKAIHREWAARLETLGRRVAVKVNDHIEKGLAEDVDENGHLLLRRPDGSTVRLIAGEVTLSF